MTRRLRSLAAGAGTAVVMQLPLAPAVAQVPGADATAAVIAGTEIRHSDLDRWWSSNDAASYQRVRRDTHEARRRALEALLAEHIVALEAGTQGLSPDRLLERETARRVRPVHDADIEDFLAATPLPPGVTRQQAAPVIGTLLRKRAWDQAREEFLQALRTSRARSVAVLLEPPRVAITAAGHNPVSGRDRAPVEVVVFADFECPFCRRAAPVLQRLRDRFPSDVSLVWRHYPLSTHPHARTAAEAAQCAHDQNRFWAYHDALFAEPPPLTRPVLLVTAARAGVDAAALEACLDSGVHRRLVEEDSGAGERVGVTGTPTVFINGIAHVGALDYAVYERTVVEELERIAAQREAGRLPASLERR